MSDALTIPAETAPPLRKRRATPERDVQRTIVRWLRQVIPGAIVAAVPNEQRGSGRTSEQRMRFGAARAPAAS